MYSSEHENQDLYSQRSLGGDRETNNKSLKKINAYDDLRL